jgi:hypothetical protein
LNSPKYFVIAAVSVVLPWSTCPIVPMFTCGFVRSNFAFAMMASWFSDAGRIAREDEKWAGRALCPAPRHAYFFWISSEMLCGTGS